MADGHRSSPGQAWLGLGSNLGDRATAIGAALACLAETPGLAVTRVSRLYRTPPWGDTDQDAFLNATVAIETSLAPYGLLERCLAIEARLGRIRERRWGPRSIDIDILHCAGVRIADPQLILPHPLWRERAFVLVPLAEIAPDLVIEGTRVTDALRTVDRSGILVADDARP